MVRVIVQGPQGTQYPARVSDVSLRKVESEFLSLWMVCAVRLCICAVVCDCVVLLGISARLPFDGRTTRQALCTSSFRRRRHLSDTNSQRCCRFKVHTLRIVGSARISHFQGRLQTVRDHITLFTPSQTFKATSTTLFRFRSDSVLLKFLSKEIIGCDFDERYKK